MGAGESEKFLEVIKDEFRLRIQRNPKYSLRAFARDLNIESSRLSKILKRLRPISPEMMTVIGANLGLSIDEIEKMKGSDTKKDTAGRQLGIETFKIIADNIHYSILELMKVKGFRPDPRWIAKRLHKNVYEVNEALDKLQQVGLLEIVSKHEWRDLSDGSSTHMIGYNYTSYAQKLAQKQVLEQALEALKIPIEHRDHSSMMMATNSKKIQKAKEMIREFRLKLCEFLEDTKEKDCVAQFQASIFPLDRNENLKGKK